MSIATDLTRLQTAKADLKTAIEGKGVTVPSATKIDGYADLVDSIETGGGGFSFDDIGEGNYSGADVVYTKTSMIYTAFFKANIKSFNAPNLTTIVYANNGDMGDKSHCFHGSTIESANIPLLRETQDFFFSKCTALNDVKLPSAQYVGANGFNGCISLTCFVGQSAAIVYTSGFEGCSNLEVVDIKGGNTNNGIRSYGFRNCTKLNKLVLRSSTAVTKLENTNAFQSTPFASDGTGGTLYVPQSLLSQYTQATNWSTILGYTNNQILPIEGSIYETQYADGTPISA